MNLLILCLIISYSFIEISLVLPILFPLIIASGQIAPELRGFYMGCVIAAAALARCLALPFFGSLSDRWGRKRALNLALSSFFLGTVLGLVAVLSKSWILLLLSRLLNGAGAGSYAIAQATIADSFSGAQKTKNFALLNSCCGIGYIIGPLLGSFFSQEVGPFILVIFLSLGNWILMASFFKEPQTPKKISPKRSFIRRCAAALQAKERRFIFGMLLTFCLGWGFFCECLPIFLMHRFQFGSRELGSFYIYSGIMIAFCQGVGIRPFANRFSPQYLFIGGLTALSITIPFLLLIHSVVIFYITLVPIVLFQTLVFPTVATLLSNSATREEQGEILGVFQSLQAIGMALGPLLLGSFTSIIPTLPVIAGAVAPAAALLWMALRPVRKSTMI